MDTEVGSAEEKDAQPLNSAKGPILPEAHLIAILSVIVYMFAYLFDKAYLNYFGFDAVFAEITTKKLLIVGSSVLSGVLFIWNFANVLPSRAIEYLLMGIYVFFLEGFLFLLAGLVFFFSGVTWWFLGLITVGVLLLFWQLTVIFKTGLRFEKFRLHLSERVTAEEKVRSHILATSLLDSMHPAAALSIVAAIFMVPSAGILGSSYAHWKTSFLTIKFDSSYYLIVGEYQGGLLAAEIKQIGLPAYRLTGAVRSFPAQSETSEMRTHKFPDGQAPIAPIRVRYSFADFWQRNFGPPIEYRR
jgi:hypothetical protein